MAATREHKIGRAENCYVRLFKPGDAYKVSYLISRCLNETLSREFSREQLQFFHRRFTPSGLRKLATHWTVFLAVNGERILGTASLKEDRVKAVFVNPNFHRQGMGRLLMGHVEDEARRRRIKSCSLYSNHQATEFYERINYHKVDETEDHGLNLIIMRKELEAAQG